MNTIHLFETKDQLLTFRDTVGVILSKELSTNIKGRRLDELSARLLGAADFNTALGMITRKAQVLALHENDSVLGAFDDVYLSFPKKLSTDIAGIRPYMVSNHLEEKYFHPCHGLQAHYGFFDENSWHMDPPGNVSDDYRKGWLKADDQAVQGVLNLKRDADISSLVSSEGEYLGFRHRQAAQIQSLQADIDTFVSNEKRLQLVLRRGLGEDAGKVRWICEQGRWESVELFEDNEQALLDAVISMGAFGFCSYNDFKRIMDTEGWFFDYFETSEEGLVIQLMGFEPDNDSTPNLTDEEAWAFVAGRAREGSVLHIKALEWLGKYCESERKRIREHTGY